MPIGRAIDDLERMRAAVLARQLFGFELGLLIDVARIERRVLVRRRMLDVAVHAAGAAMHDAARARARRPPRARAACRRR